MKEQVEDGGAILPVYLSASNLNPFIDSDLMAALKPIVYLTKSGATGFQKDRAQAALAEILEQFIAKELRAWSKTFPLEFYQQIFRLKKWEFDPASVKRPAVIGHYTNNIVYKRLAPGVLDTLRKKNPVVDGRRKSKHFQWLTGDVGDPKLKSHIDGVIPLRKQAENCYSV